MLDQQAGVIEPGDQQARSPRAANDNAPTRHRASLQQTTATKKPTNVRFPPWSDIPPKVRVRPIADGVDGSRSRHLGAKVWLLSERPRAKGAIRDGD